MMRGTRRQICTATFAAPPFVIVMARLDPTTTAATSAALASDRAALGRLNSRIALAAARRQQQLLPYSSCRGRRRSTTVSTMAALRASVSHEDDSTGAAAAMWIDNRRDFSVTGCGGGAPQQSAGGAVLANANGCGVDVVLPARIRLARERWRCAASSGGEGGTTTFDDRWLGRHNVAAVSEAIARSGDTSVVCPRWRADVAAAIVWGWRESVVKALSGFDVLAARSQISDERTAHPPAKAFHMTELRLREITVSSCGGDGDVGQHQRRHHHQQQQFGQSSGNKLSTSRDVVASSSRAPPMMLRLWTSRPVQVVGANAAADLNACWRAGGPHDEIGVGCVTDRLRLTCAVFCCAPRRSGSRLEPRACGSPIVCCGASWT